MNIRTITLTQLFSLLMASTIVSAQTNEYLKWWSDPAIQERIESGIEQNRKGNAKLIITDSKGRPLKNFTYSVEQVTHDFLFGANIFMLKGFEKEEENKKFEQHFINYFNYASAPFYWKTLEPQQGNIRFDSTSEKIYRRPPPDVVVKFCKDHNVTIKGHTLVWEHPVHGMPDWAPRNAEAIDPLIRKRITEIAARYGNDIKIWDVVNESLKLHPDFVLPSDYVFDTFEKAEQALPGAQLLINEVTSQSWDNLSHVNSPYYLQIQNLLCRGAQVDGIGLQFHFFSEELHNKVVAGEAMKPVDMFRALDLLADFKKPIHVTEITIPTLPANQLGEAIQAKLTENFYKLWFSHPKIEAITWWNMVDETAVPGEDKWKGGFLRRDFSIKPSGVVLDQLLNKDWKTNFTKSSSVSNLAFRCFYGKYKVKITKGKKTVTREIYIRKGAENNFTLKLD